MIGISMDGLQSPVGVLTVAKAVENYLLLRMEEGVEEKSDTYRHMRKHLVDRFCHVFGSWPLADITTEHLRNWGKLIAQDENGNPMSDVTRRHHLVTVKTFFKRGTIERWLPVDPSRALMLPVIPEADVHVIGAREAFEFFKTNRDARCVGRVALEAFGGLRYSSAASVVAEDLKFDRKGIEMPSAKHKSRKRKFRQGQPANLWEWLTLAPADCWTTTVRQYADEKKDMMVMGKIRPARLRTEEDKARSARTKNIWRHSFASYLLARVKDFGPVAYQMQHSNTETTEIYEGRGDEFDAWCYFAITPATVLLNWEDFRERVEVRFKASQLASTTPVIPVLDVKTPAA